MSSTLAYKCDECGATASYEDSRSWINIEIKPYGGYGADIHRDLCTECWKKRKAAVLVALTDVSGKSL
jgi:hypothetical protein